MYKSLYVLQSRSWKTKKKFDGSARRIPTYSAFRKTPAPMPDFEMGKVPAGLEPDDWKPFDDVGAGAREIRIKDGSGIYRVMYVAKFEETIYVLHCFERKSQVTSKHDKEVASVRSR